MPLPSLLAWLLNRQAVLISSVLLNGFSLICGKVIRRYETPSAVLINPHKFLELPVERIAKAEIICYLFNTTWLATMAHKSAPKDMGNDKMNDGAFWAVHCNI